MPLRIIYTEDGGIIAKGEGIVTGSDIKEINNIIYASPKHIEEIAYQVGDFTDVTDVFISSSEIEELAIEDKEASAVNPNMLIALVGRKDLIYGLSRMWEAFTDDSPFETMVFRKMEDAQQWIKEKLQKKP
ncbi:MAG: hypothetical protein SWE60_10300 [Thermodesulfobacteriota bacterium]|nr:hypothetical protein [Thermodesulfobacteriota bacterium]